MEWKPIIDLETRVIYQEKLEEIAAVLLKNCTGMERMGLMHGKAGVALFFFYYTELTGEEVYYDSALHLICQVLDNMNKFTFHTFSKGEAGVGWVLEHLAQNKFIDFDTDKIMKSMDRFIYEQMEFKLENGICDAFNGAVGYGIYLLSRANKENVREFLIRLVNGLYTIALRPREGGITWKSIIYDSKNKASGINLGLIYGTAGIIVFLSKLIEQGIYIEKTQELLEGAVTYLLSQALPPGSSPYCFPGWTGAHRDLNLNTCGLSLGYGDLSTALTLWHAAAVTGNRQWKQKAIDTLMHSTQLTALTENRVMDGSLSVGTSGISHLYNRMYHYTGREVFLTSARYWLEQTMNMAKYPDGFAGYRAWRSKKSRHKDKDFALIEGIAGIGLALISAISDIEPKWDRCFLLN